METSDASEPHWQHRHPIAVVALAALLIGVMLTGCQASNASSPVRPSASGSPPGQDTNTAIANSDAGSLTFVNNRLYTESVTAAATPTATATRLPTRTPASTQSASSASRPTPSAIRAKIEIVWPHGGVPVREADLANITAYLIAEPSSSASNLPAPPACDWNPTVRLWAALNADPARQVAVGQKRMVTADGRTFPVWDFNDVDVAAARDPANKLTFFTTVDGVRTLHNVWTHAADARTVFPQTDVPTGTLRRLPVALDSRIEIVWPHDNLPPEQATLANITAYLSAPGTLQTIPPDVSWTPTAKLHWSLNADTEKTPGTGIAGVPRTLTASNGVRFQAWDFNDVDVSAARETLNRLYFWVTVDDVATFPNVWAHAVDARTVFPQPDMLGDCR
jgi:hypothetical protein